MKALIILRGLPGAGKSTLANLLAGEHFPVLSVDDYFTDAETGAYAFEYEKNHLAYKACEEGTEKHLQAGTEKIFLANTFTMDWEIEPYFRMAEKYNYQLHVVTVEKYHSGHNVHAVSDAQLFKMAEKYKVKLF
jgi:predicted kinase